MYNNVFFVSGEGGEEGSPEEGDKLEGDEDNDSMTPTSSPNHIDEDVSSPPPGDLPSPTSPRSVIEDGVNER